MSELESNAWLSFKDLVENFLRNTRAENYIRNVQKLLQSYKSIDCCMSMKLSFVYGHLLNFPENLDGIGDKQG